MISADSLMLICIGSKFRPELLMQHENPETTDKSFIIRRLSLGWILSFPFFGYSSPSVVEGTHCRRVLRQNVWPGAHYCSSARFYAPVCAATTQAAVAHLGAPASVQLIFPSTLRRGCSYQTLVHICC